MELYQLRQFAAVAKYENMTRAAESLNVAQPAVSKTIRNMESELGAELFERTGKGLRRTEQGDILLRYARTILEAERDARGEIEESLHRTGGLCICALSCAERISEIRPRAATCCSIPRYRGTRCLQAPSCCTMRRCAWLCPRDTGMPIGKAYR